MKEFNHQKIILNNGCKLTLANRKTNNKEILNIEKDKEK
jgi:hypothetical protein